MTFKKINKSACYMRKKTAHQAKAQAIFEYCILTAVVMTVILFVGSSGIFCKQAPADPPGMLEICNSDIHNAINQIPGMQNGNQIVVGSGGQGGGLTP